MTKKEKAWLAVKILLVIAILLLALNYLAPFLNSPKVQSTVKDLGFLGPLIVIAYIVVSHVLAPLFGTPGVLLGAALFGIYQTLLYIYIAGLVSSAICFLVAKKYGRALVVRLAGKKTIKEIDLFVDSLGTELLILSRLFGFALFEVISYAAGFTKMSFRKFFLITVVFSAPPAAAFAFLFRNTSLRSSTSLFLWLGSITLAGLIFSYLIKKRVNKKK